MRQKLLAIDIDGTAVRDDYRLSHLNKKAIEQARLEGHVVAFATGRRDVDMLSLGSDGKCVNYLISNNGGKILCHEDETVLLNELVDPESCRKLITYCLEHHLQLQICNGPLWQVNRMTESTMEYAQNIGAVPELIESLDEVPWKGGLEGFTATCDWEPVAAFVKENLPQVCYVHSQPQCIDVMAAGISKWKSILWLANLLEIPEENIITVGNYYNDIEMIQSAATGIAVANAPELVKKKADYVTKRDNNNDAVAEVISKFCGISLE